MATAKKLPSGSWRCRVYDYTDDSGKMHYRSFTCDDPSPKGKRKCELMAAEFAGKKERVSHSYINLTLERAIDQYIGAKNNILSPSTIIGYKGIKKRLTPLLPLKLSEIDQRTVDVFINQYSSTHSSKSVRNLHGLLSAVLQYHGCDLVLRTKLPQKEHLVYTLPSDDDIRRLIADVKDRDPDLYIAICLAAFGTLRRSEVCGAYSDDVDRNNRLLHVHNVLIKDENHKWVLKPPKTVESDRYVELPAFVIDSLPKSGRLVSANPDAITQRFKRLLKRVGCPDFRFHDLRHYSASIMHALGVPDSYIMQRGGWRTDTVLKEVYRGTLDEYSKKFTDITNHHFDSMSP